MRKREQKDGRAEQQILTIRTTKTTETAVVRGKEKTVRRKKREVVAQRDLRYRAPLSYRHMMMLGWLCIVLQQLSSILSFAGKLDPGVAASSGAMIGIGDFAGGLFMPFLLLANFSKILTSRKQFKSQLLMYGGLSVVMGLALVVVYEHFVKGIANTAAQLDPELGDGVLNLFRKEVFKDGYLAYNMFIDLFLCTLFMFFLTYQFKRPVGRGWMIGFRLLAILPVAYELACIVVKAMCKHGDLTLPMYASSFLSTKPPMTFAAFMALALYVKRQETVFFNSGRSYEEYERFLETNDNSLRFSIHACKIFVIAAAVDLVIFFTFFLLMTTGDVLAAGEMAEQILENEETLKDMTYRTMSVAQAAGFGQSLVLLFVAPFVLLFSYTKKHKDTKMDMLIPMIGVALIVALYVEALFQAVCQVPGMLQEYLGSLDGMDLMNMEELFAAPM